MAPTPEYAMGGQFSVKSTVFNFGVILLKIISGKRNSGFYRNEHAQTLTAYLWKEGGELDIADTLLTETCLVLKVVRCIHIGLLYVQEDPEAKPTMSYVVVLLSSESMHFLNQDNLRFLLFEGALDNAGSLKQQYELGKSIDAVVLVIVAYKALRDRAPYPPNRVVGHLDGSFAFIVFDESTSTLFVAAYQSGKVPLCWGITDAGYVAIADDADLLKGASGKSLASFPQGCFFSTDVGQLRSYENPKNKITVVPATEEEVWGAKYIVEGPAVVATTE